MSSFHSMKQDNRKR